MFRVAVSAGHGQKRQKDGSLVHDPGAINPVVHASEHIVCLRIQHLIDTLLRFTPGVDIVLIPSGTLEEKVKIINRGGFGPFGLAVEIHLNAGPPEVRGTEVLYYRGSVKGRQYGDIFQKELLRQIRRQSRDRGVKERSDLYFLKATRCPAVITEAEFISNNKIARRLREDFLTEKIAFAHAEAIWKIARSCN